MIVQKLVQQEGYSVSQACELLDLSHSSYYYASHLHQADQIEMALKVEAGKHPTYGTRRLTHQLRRAPYEHGKHAQQTVNILIPVMRTWSKT